MQTVTLSLFRFGSVGARVWAFAQMGFARAPLSRMPGLRFWKLLGSGVGEGFTPLPNTGVYAILCAWESEDAAREGLSARVFKRYRAQSEENWTLWLEPTSVRGQWSAKEPFDAPDKIPPMTGPIAALTRATIKPSILLRFWGRVPSISKVIGKDPSVMFKIGVGEVPWFHQVTFSIWPDAKSMAQFARAGGPHAQAIKAVREGEWFSEELYARFKVTGQTGHWTGTKGLDGLTQVEVTP
ncbi:MAG: spheroidene monooxygenase [Pseudomonadota bacterium]